ncbi:hypothetical protein PSH66_24355 [Pseudomonas sp. FP597]|uniref:hypothetical protein n=1 Tax=Pseudomonas sp. FP597 TaxID=2954096 RepID=UPI0001E96951|nr:hypothetical protein [Pseudomonas sp. FP597]EFQ61309.1 hypothetical protein PFWH6_4868 [Pseudomonas fluorescens WH6]WLI05691.1 hypothetical protein PSH66_24355 [Pseudomonas sp. FP597]
MLGAINSTLGNFQYPPLQQDDAISQRKKRSIEQYPFQLNAQESDGSTHTDARRGRSGGLDSLGKGNLL